MVDFGLTRLARTRTRQKTGQEELNKPSANSEVEKNQRKPFPIHIAQRATEVEKKKTSPDKVKMASNKKRRKLDKNVTQSPNLKILQPARMDKIVARSSESSPRTKKSQNTFNYLLQSLENIITRKILSLTPAVTKPRSKEAAESQWERILQDHRK